MRQAGVLAAAALVALETMVDRLAEDHVRARELATGLAAIPGVIIDPTSVETNILMLQLRGGAAVHSAAIVALRELGLLVTPWTAEMFRLVTHRHIRSQDVPTVLAGFRSVCESHAESS